jgi:putative FmdB family regulatory protein
MPAYDFKCKACDRTIEITRGARDAAPVPCPVCGEPMKMVFHPVGVHFKGSGFHNTDYPKSSKPAAAPDGAPAAAPCEATGQSPACEGCPSAEGSKD